jgi:hypothetical protein
MKLSFSIRDSLGGLLTGTTVAAIVISHPVAALDLGGAEPNAMSYKQIAQITIPNPVLFDSPLGSSSGAHLEKDGTTNILHLSVSQLRNVLVAQKEEPSPPRPTPPGGGR